jgi:hypothetical protein
MFSRRTLVPIPSYELTRLDGNNFEHLVNALAMRVLGAGVTGFGPGSDGGRDGFFEGTAPYPSITEQWSGLWYIQSKFHSPHLSSDSQKWLIDQVRGEIKSFSQRGSKRVLPNNWIIATNIDPSGSPQTGSFDKIRAAVSRYDRELSKRTHIWGGRKILDLLAIYPDIVDYYGEFLTPGNILSKIYNNILDENANIDEILRYLTVTQMTDQQYTKLEQAGSTVDNRPGIQRLFTDIPFRSKDGVQMAADALAATIAQIHRSPPVRSSDTVWTQWSNSPRRARAWFIKGGPGQGKSTLTQYVAQIQRAAIVLSSPEVSITAAQRTSAEEIKTISTRQGLWPEYPRIPVTIELKEYAFWLGHKEAIHSTRTLSYISEKLHKELGIPVQPKTLKRAFSLSRWLFIFDGLDEVPGDMKDFVASEILHFVDDCLISCKADAMVVCTSRPQGYSGQFSSLDAASIDLAPLSPKQALECAKPLLILDRSNADSRAFIETLEQALRSPAIAEIMTTPLQSHIMAVIVRDGGRPPERKWQLFNTFYDVIKKREANRNLPERPLATLLREGDQLLRAIHNRLGFELHARAETSEGAAASINRKDLKIIFTEVVEGLQDINVKSTVATLMKATTERLVLVNTPDNGEYARFDIRPLQEFFAAEYIYRHGDPEHLDAKIRTIAGSSHWREVMHFLISALVENGRISDLAIATSIISEIDSGSTSDIRIVNRRMARGAITSCRLLSEGVLEQDRQIRTRFRNAIAPVSGQTDLSKIFDRKLQKHSTSWLQDVLISSLQENSIPETIGSTILLATLLPDRDKRSAFVQKFVEDCPIDYKAYFVTALSSGIASGIYPNPKFPRWTIAIALKLLVSDKWFELSETIVRASTSLISRNIVSACDVARSIGFSNELIRLMPPLFGAGMFVRYGTSTTTEIRYGGFLMEIYAPDPEMNVMDWEDHVFEDLKTARGYFQSIYRALYMIRHRTAEAVNEFKEVIGGRFRNATMLPSSITCFLRSNIQLYDAMPIESCGDLIDDFKPGYIKILMMSRSNNYDSSSPVDWRKLVAEKPHFFSYILMSNLSETERPIAKESLDFIGDGDNLEYVAKVFSASNVIMDQVSEWGVLFNPSLPFSGELRRTALEDARSPVLYDRYVERISTFEVDLPKEAPFLPHILGVMMEALDVSNRYDTDTRLLPRLQISEWISQYVPDRRLLKQIWNSESFSREIRAASLVLFLLHTESSQEDMLDELYDLYDDEFSSWLLPGIGYVLFDKIALGNKNSVERFGAILEKSTHNFFGRAALDKVLQAWREATGSPVKNSAEYIWK